ncbi:MAG: dTDP-glucose 4,6-dehydratase [Candidatus Omnitrophica bacterium]|nr:dTDP-glucose 4,6-dehydratase [Candidatus Omnitrophota bacterium]
MRKILVTGGCGFIGSNFIRFMLNKRRDIMIVNLDKLTYSGNPANLRDVQSHPRYRFIKGDICDRAKVDRLTKGSWGIVNFSAETHVDRSIQNADVFLKTNILGAHTLLESARTNRVKRFLQISTDEVYGSLRRGEAGEGSPLRPNNPYSASKAAADGLVRSYFVTFCLPVLIARSSNNFGPFQFPEKVIPLFVTNLMEGKKVPLYGRGEHQRDWIFVLDNVRALELILHRGKIGEIYNVGQGHPISNLELTKKILKVCGAGEEFIRHVKDRPGHDFRYSLNVGKVRRLGFRPRFQLEEALRLTVDWYRQNKAWWRPLKKDVFTLK